MIPKPKLIFIVGAPRSGTTWLQSMIGAHPSVCTTTEFPIFHSYIVPMKKKYNQEKNDTFPKGLPMIWDDYAFKQFLIEFVEKCFSDLIKRCDKENKAILIKDPYNVFYIETIFDLFPQSKLIHIIRDGRSASLSLVEAKKNLGFGFHMIADAVVHWKNSVENGLKGRDKENYIEIKYENLLNETIFSLKNIFEFCDLKSDENLIIDIAKNYKFDEMKNRQLGPDQKTILDKNFWREGKIDGWVNGLSMFDKFIIHKNAGDLLLELGYVLDLNWWFEGNIVLKYWILFRYYFLRFFNKLYNKIT